MLNASVCVGVGVCARVCAYACVCVMELQLHRPH